MGFKLAYTAEVCTQGCLPESLRLHSRPLEFRRSHAAQRTEVVAYGVPYQGVVHAFVFVPV